MIHYYKAIINSHMVLLFGDPYSISQLMPPWGCICIYMSSIHVKTNPFKFVVASFQMPQLQKRLIRDL